MSSATATVTIVETDRLIVREIVENDGLFMLELLNSPSFLKYIGDRGVRSVDDARSFIETRYRQSYRVHGYGLYAVDLKTEQIPIGMCGFVRRDTLPAPDLGFAFLPQYEGLGFGFESARAMVDYGHDALGFEELLAITDPDNSASIRLLSKLGFISKGVIETENEKLSLFRLELQ